jgi:hypothetical protein
MADTAIRYSMQAPAATTGAAAPPPAPREQPRVTRPALEGKRQKEPATFSPDQIARCEANRTLFFYIYRHTDERASARVRGYANETALRAEPRAPLTT